MEKVKDYGSVKFGTPDDYTEVKIQDSLFGSFNDGRVISIRHLENDKYVLAVENPSDSIRDKFCSMLLTHDTLMAIFYLLCHYTESRSLKLDDELERMMDGNDINIEMSDNLKFINQKNQ